MQSKPKDSVQPAQNPRGDSWTLLDKPQTKPYWEERKHITKSSDKLAVPRSSNPYLSDVEKRNENNLLSTPAK